MGLAFEALAEGEVGVKRMGLVGFHYRWGAGGTTVRVITRGPVGAPCPLGLTPVSLSP